MTDLDEEPVFLSEALTAWHESTVSARRDPVVALGVQMAVLATSRPVPSGTPVFLELAIPGAERGEPLAIDAVATPSAPGDPQGFRVRFAHEEPLIGRWLVESVLQGAGPVPADGDGGDADVFVEVDAPVAAPADESSPTSPHTERWPAAQVRIALETARRDAAAHDSDPEVGDIEVSDVEAGDVEAGDVYDSDLQVRDVSDDIVPSIEVDAALLTGGSGEGAAVDDDDGALELEPITAEESEEPTDVPPAALAPPTLLAADAVVTLEPIEEPFRPAPGTDPFIPDDGSRSADAGADEPATAVTHQPFRSLLQESPSPTAEATWASSQLSTAAWEPAPPAETKPGFVLPSVHDEATRKLQRAAPAPIVFDDLVAGALLTNTAQEPDARAWGQTLPPSPAPSDAWEVPSGPAKEPRNDVDDLDDDPSRAPTAPHDAWAVEKIRS